jgi:hypothetical protein
MADNNSRNALVMELADADAGARVLLRLIESFWPKRDFPDAAGA